MANNQRLRNEQLDGTGLAERQRAVAFDHDPRCRLAGQRHKPYVATGTFRPPIVDAREGADRLQGAQRVVCSGGNRKVAYRREARGLLFVGHLRSIPGNGKPGMRAM